MPDGPAQQPAGGLPKYALELPQQYGSSSRGPPPNRELYGSTSDYTPTLVEDRFKPQKTLRDPIFLIFFIAHLIGFCVLSGIVLSEWVKVRGLGGGVGGGIHGQDTGSHISPDRHTAYLLLLVTATGLLLSPMQLMITRLYTKWIMHITLVLTICLNTGICVYFWISKYYSGAIAFTILAIYSIFSYWRYRSLIPFSSLLLEVVMDVSKRHMSIYATAMVSVLSQAAICVWYTFTTIAIYTKWTPGNPSCDNGTKCSSSTVAGLIVYATFSYLWTSQVVGNIALATVAGGPYGAWYYYGPKNLGLMPANPTLASFNRASTTSLGSITLGSLLVTVLELVRSILDVVRNNIDSDGQPAEVVFACCADCIVGFIEFIVSYFNRYAYIEIALYGKPYIAASRDTWKLFKDRGIDALVNDSLVSIAFTWGGYIIGLLATLFAYLYLHFTHPSYNQSGQYTAPVLVFSFLIGLQCSLTHSSAIEAGVSTIFVGMAEDPQVLAFRAPILFEAIRQRYPQVVQGVHVP